MKTNQSNRPFPLRVKHWIYLIIAIVVVAHILLVASCSIERRISRMNDRKPGKVSHALSVLYPGKDSVSVRTVTTVKHDTIKGQVRRFPCDSLLQATAPQLYSELRQQLGDSFATIMQGRIQCPDVIRDSVFTQKDSIVFVENTAKVFYLNYKADSLQKVIVSRDTKIDSLKAGKRTLLIIAIVLGLVIAIAVAWKLTGSYLRSLIK